MNSNNFSSVGGYQFSYTIIEYIADEYGYETVVNFIRNPNRYKGVFGKSKLEFQNDWKDYLKENIIKLYCKQLSGQVANKCKVISMNNH